LNSYGKQTTDLRDALVVGWQVWRKSLTQGPKIQEFESAVAVKVGAKYAVAVSSATAGLHLALLALELEPNSEVVTSPISFMSSSNAALYSGLKPRFVDIDPETLNISEAQTVEAITTSDSIRALIPVHMSGAACEMEELSKVCREKGVAIIEDAAHALGGYYPDGQTIGSCAFSDMTVFSFHPVKSVTTGEGGVVTTNNENLYRKLLRLRSHGINQLDDLLIDPILGYTDGVKNPWYHEMQILGFHYRLSEIQAALGLSQLRKLDRFILARRKLSLNYDSLIKDLPGVSPTQLMRRTHSAHHLYIVRIDFSSLAISRAQLMIELRKLGIGTQVHYRPIPTQPYYKSLGFSTEQLPDSMAYYAECLSLPLFPKLKFRQQKRIVSELRSILAQYS
jgi:UDP-4-amino-4,6-dideoxy-N-acetyl-beta-L-altrosamine transaminase